MPLPDLGADFLERFCQFMLGAIESKSNVWEARLVHIALRALQCPLSGSGRESTPSTVCVLLLDGRRIASTESPLHQLSSLVRERVPEGVMLGIHHIPSEALLTRSPLPAFGAVWTHCLARTSGALQPATS